MKRDLNSAELRMGDDLLDAVYAKMRGDETAAASFAIPHLKAEPIIAGSFLMSMIQKAVAVYADHLGVPPTLALDMLWSKPDGTR